MICDVKTERPANLTPDAVRVLRDLNPWWTSGRAVLPEPPQFRRPAVIDPPDADGVRHFRARFDAPHAVVVTHETSGSDRGQHVLYLPLQNFLPAF